MARLYFLLLILLSGAVLYAQTNPPAARFGTYYQQRESHFNTLTGKPGGIVFVGNSITDGAEWHQLFPDVNIINMGISGDISAGVLNRVRSVIASKPDKVFLSIGVNDLARNISADSVISNIFRTADSIRILSPATNLYIQGLLPVNDSFPGFKQHTNKGATILFINKALAAGAEKYGYSYVDLLPHFADKNGKLGSRFTNDGLHLSGDAYILWKHILWPHVYGLQEQPALVPMPRSVNWQQGRFPFYQLDNIVVSQNELVKELAPLQPLFNSKILAVAVGNGTSSVSPSLLVRLSPQRNDSSEAYTLTVRDNRIVLESPSPGGIFYGMQTLKQLALDGVYIPNCHIVDSPAYSWRGFMVDVGRNYQSMKLLKEQIDMMASYKMNIFHFHLTEDIAWRIAIDRYPALTADSNMTRDPGMYYSKAELKELVEYCRDRHILLVPEIDMPGHSAAFERALHTNMQTDKGMSHVKLILEELVESFNFPYMHIGGDEVKITNDRFLPEMVRLLEKKGVKTIGWSPGGNVPASTIRQLWMGDAPIEKGYRYLDSRHLYLNHIDPLESVVTIFHRQLGDRVQEDNQMMGAILCVWNDRRIAREEDHLLFNGVYPSMLAFAERSWRGGGEKGWTTRIGDENSKRAKDFFDFERRLLDHKQQNFSSMPFPYWKQEGWKWDLRVEKDGKQTKLGEALGGTIVLRHWWTPLIDGHIPTPKENSTVIASTRVYSEEDKAVPFLIGFDNLSRSMATNSPPAGQWDYRGSSISINGKLIPAPVWSRAGRKGSLESPLIDEDYYYRPPIMVDLKKGWNDILVKLPVKSFKGSDWQNPVKWMFTCIIPTP
ncbi:family 20 glycosylhydrolase [Flavihumibacter sp.]|uniref:family 20 glycosylhydrolase n=1 Tax=Flavihumibacter sp. TaxID=1913981 RepID=UPI002FC5F5E6